MDFSLYHIYFDESKVDTGNKQKYYLITGIGIKYGQLNDVELKLTNIAKEFSKKHSIAEEIEFHAYDIIQGKDVYKGIAIEERLALYKEVLEIVDRKVVKLIYITIDTGAAKYKMHKYTPQDWALIFLTERSDDYMRAMESKAVLVGDEDHEVKSRNTNNFLIYQKEETPGYARKKITYVEKLEFQNSKKNRLIQLADMVNYARMVTFYDQKARIKVRLKSIFNEFAWFPDKRKTWPS